MKHSSEIQQPSYQKRQQQGLGKNKNHLIAQENGKLGGKKTQTTSKQ